MWVQAQWESPENGLGGQGAARESEPHNSGQALRRSFDFCRENVLLFLNYVGQSPELGLSCLPMVFVSSELLAPILLVIGSRSLGQPTCRMRVIEGLSAFQVRTEKSSWKKGTSGRFLLTTLEAGVRDQGVGSAGPVCPAPVLALGVASGPRRVAALLRPAFSRLPSPRAPSRLPVGGSGRTPPRTLSQ